MTGLFAIGVAVAIIGWGVSKLPNTGIAGGLIILVGGVLALLSSFV